MIETKYQVGEEVYLVKDYIVVKVLIENIVVTKTKDKETVEYTVSPITNEPKKVSKTMPEAYLVKEFEVARQSALTNWENIYQNTKKALTELKPEDFDLKETKEDA